MITGLRAAMAPCRMLEHLCAVPRSLSSLVGASRRRWMVV